MNSVDTKDKQIVRKKIFVKDDTSFIIHGERYELSAYGNKHSDGSRLATVRLVK